MPSFRAIASAMEYGSPRSAQLLVERLVRDGHLERADGRPTLSREQLNSAEEQTIEIPLVGNVPCGGPWFAEQHVEAHAKVSTKIAKPGREYFLLRARGDSMNLSGIRDGDLVLVRKQQTAMPGDRVAALVDQEVTIKHFYIEDGLVILKPNSTDNNFRPMVLSDEFVIQGVVMQTIPDIFKE